MIFRPAHHQCFEFVLTRDAAEERPEVRLDFGFDQITTLFCREQAMHGPGHVGVRHGASVGGGGRGWARENAARRFCFPALGIWLWIRRPYGTRRRLSGFTRRWKRRAIVSCPSGTEDADAESRGRYPPPGTDLGRHPAAGTARAQTPRACVPICPPDLRYVLFGTRQV